MKPVTARELGADGAMAALLRDALAPNLVHASRARRRSCTAARSRTSRTAAAGMATRAGLRLADFVVTEAGFGADLGAEKFVDISAASPGRVPTSRSSWPPCGR